MCLLYRNWLKNFIKIKLLNLKKLYIMGSCCIGDIDLPMICKCLTYGIMKKINDVNTKRMEIKIY